MKLLKKGLYILLPILVLGIFTSCEDNDDESIKAVEGLDFVIATISQDGLEVGVVPSTLSGGEVLYTIDFGTSDTDEDQLQTSGPMRTYTYPAVLDDNDDPVTTTYTITVTASVVGYPDVTISKEYDVTFIPAPTVPTGPTSPLAGTWRLAPEAGALGVGPMLDDVSWWSNSSDDVTLRSCLFDDEYVFDNDGNFMNVLGADTWIETWQGAASEGCAAPVAPHNGTAGTYVFNQGAGTLTINGTGAFMGLAKVNNDGELGSPSAAVSSITYQATLVDANTLELDIEAGSGVFWSFKFVRDAPPTIEGTWKLSPEAGALGVGPMLDDVSWWSNSSDDVATRACLFDDEYVFNADGTFSNVLGTDTWIETWQGASSEGCGTPVAPHDGSASATYTFNEAAGTLTIDGTGAFMGLAKVNNDGELASPSAAVSSITYQATLVDANTLELDIEAGSGVFWSFKFTKQ